MSLADKRIYLASRSPRRRELLKQIGVPFDLLLLRQDLRRGVDVDETPLPDESPGAYALRIASAKATTGMYQVAQRGLPLKPVLAADTSVVFDEQLIGKPEDTEHAVRILHTLSGHEHQVVTAIAVAHRDQVESQLSVSSVWFRELADAEIRRYVASGEPGDKAGAYAIQGRAGAFVTRIAGSYSGIMGLPLAETADLLARFNISML
ncbi:MAG: Maf family nucleotide pyrophosphatase [Betaproteobacteria bacterium]|nr:Maf family nucleotide pyrophosphatase [Betaproteobacteria bacterium]MDH3437442.1 Maf family nucleotide pyrophosphatase [Betaproteobacteria bacterium]